MSSIGNTMLRMDEGISGILGQWNSYSTALATIFAIALTYRLFSGRDPDTHPMRLARQSLPSMVRQEGESSVFRSVEAVGDTLQTGLDVKEPGASRWSRGRDGDLRDIWKKVIAGVQPQEGQEGGGEKGRIMTVLGRENVIQHSTEDITRQINLIGNHIAQNSGIRVAVYLPNSIELLATLFACSFYPNLTTILIPFDVSQDELVSMLRRSAADTVVAAPGYFSFDAVVKSYPMLRQLIWVVDEGNAHMDWNEVPEGMGGTVNVSTWQEIVHDSPIDAGRELPEPSTDSPMDVVMFWRGKPGQTEEMIRFTQANLISAVAAQLAALPPTEKLTPKDIFLPADSLTSNYTLILTLAALYSNSSLALNAVASKNVDLIFATQGISPTVVVSSPESAITLHSEFSSRAKQSAILRTALWSQTRDLAFKGVLPSGTIAGKLLTGAQPPLGKSPESIRLLYIGDRAGAGSPSLSAQALSELRALADARVIYALTAARVAGAVAQTWLYDYRVNVGSDNATHFGPPVVSTEVLLRDSGNYKTTDEKSEGEIVVRGPSVTGGETALGVVGRMREDYTLAYA